MSLADFKLRPAQPGDAAGIARVHVLSWQSAYRGLLPQPMLEALDIDTRSSDWLKWLEAPGATKNLVAVSTQDPPEVLGFVSGGTVRGDVAGFDCEIAAIYLLPEVQGRGVGYALFSQMQQALRTDGHRRMLVWVLDSNARARGFYERLGGVVALSRTATIGGSFGTPLEVAETGYAWDLA